MPNQIISEDGPFRRPGGGGFFKVEERISLVPNVEREGPPSVTRDAVAPECWIRKVFPRRTVDIENYQIVHYLAEEKEASAGEIALWVGLGALVVIAGIATGGLMIAAAGASAATAAAVAGTGAAYVGTSAAVFTSGAAIAAGVGTAAAVPLVNDLRDHLDVSLEDPDDWEMGSTVISTNGPFEREINERPLSDREFYLEYDCDRPITGDVGEDTGSGVTIGDEPIDDEPIDDEPSDGSSTAPVDSGSGTAPVDSGSSTTPTGSGSTGG